MAGHRAAAWVVVVLTGLLLVLATAAAHAEAARVGPLTSSTLLGRSYPYGALTSMFGTAAPSLAGTPINCTTNTWTVTGGTMQVTGGAVISTTNALVTATVPLCFSSGANAEAGGDLRTSGSGSAFGVLLHAAAGGRPSTAAVYDSANGTVRLQRISATGTLTTWNQRTGLSTANGVRHLRLWYLDGVYTATLNGTTLFTHTVPDPTTRAAVEANGAVGIVAVSDTKTTFDNFQGYSR
jgi:hypothetical protein